MFKRIKWALDGRSPLWPKVRKEHLEKSNCCLACGSRNKLEVHHIIPFNVDPTKELDLSNLMTLCNDCHIVIGHLKNFRLYNKDVQSMVFDFSARRYRANCDLSERKSDAKNEP